MSAEHSKVYHRIETVENYADIHLETQRYIEANYDKRIVLTDLVEAKGFSQRQIQRALSWHNTNWQRMVLDVRMRRAKELLANSGEPIGNIAESVGYDHSQFSRTFKAEEGMGPEEYREWVRTSRTT